MFLKSVSLVNFKNYTHAEFSFQEGVNCILGENGSGKTNILDAIHYLSNCKSFLNTIDKQNIKFGEHFFVIQGSWMEDKTNVTDIYCGVKSGVKKVFKKNKVEYEKLAEHIGKFPAVIISPYDRDLISEGSEIRRKWMDSIISQFDKSFLDKLIRYTKILDQRNALLKHFYENGIFERESIEIWDKQLIQFGTQIYQRRKMFLEEFISVFQSFYNFIGEESEEVKLEYKSQLNDSTFEELLKQNTRKDAQYQYTNAGVHKDDLVFTIKDQPIKKFGSQGQQKSFVIALRLAQFDCLTKNLNQKPILMLDDIFDKLDNKRVKKLMSMVSDNIFGQVFVTDTEEDRIMSVFNEINIPYHLLKIEKETLKLELNE
jgi:DNA replication and repair protein RecF